MPCAPQGVKETDDDDDDNDVAASRVKYYSKCCLWYMHNTRLNK
jgi:hypothetical protein